MMNTAKGKYIVGADIGGTDVKFVLLDASGEVVARSRLETEARRGPARAMARIVHAVEALLAAEGIPQDKLAALGIGAAGPLDTARGVVVQAPNLPGWEEVPMEATLSRGLGVPVFMENDANLAAFGENRLGAGQGLDCLVCFTLGTGIGGGIILNGEIYSGALGAGAELGHITIDQAGARCNCGNRGCLEALASATAVARMAAEALNEGKGKIISALVGGDAEKVEAETVYRAALKGDEDAAEILAQAGRHLGVGIANVVNVFAPQMVVVGGGLMKAGLFILTPAREEAMHRALEAFTVGLAIVPARLGDLAGAIGAACYAMHKLEGR